MLALATKMTGEPVRPLTPAVAVSLFVPDLVPRVQATDACPCASVDAEVADKCPPPAVTANVTETAETPAPDAAVTLTTRGCGRPCPTVPDWLLPATGAMADGGGGGLVAPPPPPQPAIPANTPTVAVAAVRFSRVTPCPLWWTWKVCRRNATTVPRRALNTAAWQPRLLGRKCGKYRRNCDTAPLGPWALGSALPRRDNSTSPLWPHSACATHCATARAPLTPSPLGILQGPDSCVIEEANEITAGHRLSISVAGGLAPIPP